MDKKQFNKLQEKWDKKLEKSGFKDLESRKTGHLENNTTSGGTLDIRRHATWESQAEYYRLATDFLNEHDFQNETQKIVWEYHSLGLSNREIAITLNKVRRKKIGRFTVWEILKSLRETMFNKYGIK